MVAFGERLVRDGLCEGRGSVGVGVGGCGGIDRYSRLLEDGWYLDITCAG